MIMTRWMMNIPIYLVSCILGGIYLRRNRRQTFYPLMVAFWAIHITKTYKLVVIYYYAIMLFCGNNNIAAMMLLYESSLSSLLLLLLLSLSLSLLQISSVLSLLLLQSSKDWYQHHCWCWSKQVPELVHFFICFLPSLAVHTIIPDNERNTMFDSGKMIHCNQYQKKPHLYCPPPNYLPPNELLLWSLGSFPGPG